MKPEQIAEAVRLALAMQWWDRVPVRWPCACTWPCQHGQTCEACRAGRLAHTSRAPLPLRRGECTRWQERYVCDNPNCYPEATYLRPNIPERPWGYLMPDGTPVLFDGLWCPGLPRSQPRRGSR